MAMGMGMLALTSMLEIKHLIELSLFVFGRGIWRVHFWWPQLNGCYVY